MADESDDARLELFCSHCNILVAARVRATARGPVTEEVAALAPEDSVYSTVEYKIALCGRCNGPFLVEEMAYELDGQDLYGKTERVLFPATREGAPAGLPATVQRAHENAARSFQAALYEPCVIMCRKALEALCVELGARRGSLNQRLDQLVREGRLDQRLFTWANALRVVGNDAAHDLDVVIGVDDARDALEFVEAILTNVFTLTRKFEAFQRRRQGGSEPSAP